MDKNSETLQTLINLIVEAWRFTKLFNRVVEKLDAGQGKKYLSQMNFFKKHLEQSLDNEGLTIMDLEGQIFNSGMAVTTLNIDEFNIKEPLIIENMIEPIIMGPDGLVKPGKVMLRKAKL